MSRGAGHLMRKIERLFADEPDHAWTLEDLCERVLHLAPGTVEKRHRVSVRRAALKVVKASRDWSAFRADETQGRTLVFQNRASWRSRAIADLKRDNLNCYRRKREVTYCTIGSPLTEADILAVVDDPENNTFADWYKQLLRDSSKERAALHIAERDGDEATAAQLRKKFEDDRLQVMAKLKADGGR